jgi:hypothetical protein
MERGPDVGAHGGDVAADDRPGAAGAVLLGEQFAALAGAVGFTGPLWPGEFSLQRRRPHRRREWSFQAG